MMEFPDTFDEFVKDYGFVDKDEVYTNGSELIPVFRVKQWLEHIQKPTQMIDKSNFLQEQYKADTKSAYACGYNRGFKDGIRSLHLERIKADIDMYLAIEGFGSEYRNDIKQIIDKHIRGKGNIDGSN